MIRKVKMINIKLIYAGLLAGLLFSLLSCRNLFSQKNNSSQEADTVIISGKITPQDIRVKPEYDTSSENNSVIAELDSAISRYAIPDLPTAGTNVWYTITAYRGSMPQPGTVAIDSTTHDVSFSVPLSQGTWILVARGYNNETTQDSTTQILEGKSEAFVIDGNTNKSKTDITITAEPILKDTGSLNLEIKVYSSINTIIAEWQQKVSGTPTSLKQVLQRGTDFTGAANDLASAYFTMEDTPASGGTQVNTASGGVISVPAGIYDVKLSFYKENYSAIQTAETAGSPYYPVYTIPKETVYVYKNMQTSTWHNTGNKIEITQAKIEYNTAHTFFVKFASTETIKNGSSRYPFTSLQTAVDEAVRVNDGGDYTICLLDDFVEASTTSSYSTTSPNKGTLVKIITENGKPLHLTIRSDSASEKRTINVNRSSSNKGGIFYLNGSSANLYLTLENLILTGAYSEKTGAVIGMENATANTGENAGTFTGARVTVKNCILKDNITIADSGGAIFVAKHNSLAAYNTVFKNNQARHTSYGNAGAVYAYGGLTVDGCVFDGNSGFRSHAIDDPEDNGSGGAIMVNLHSDTTNDNLNVIIKNSTFTNNVAFGAGGAIQINTKKSRPSGSDPAAFPLVQFENVVIKNNKSSNTSLAGGIGLGTQSTIQTAFEIKGINQITDNYCSDGASGFKECNVYLPEDKNITVTGNISGSKIGITRADASSISGGGGLAFTSGYSSSVFNNPTNPTEIFFNDDSSCIVDSELYSNEASIIAAPSQSGSLTPNYDLSKLDITLNRKKISYGQNNTILVTVFKNSSLLSANDVEMSYTLSSFGGEIEAESTEAGNTPKYFSLDSSNPFKLHFYEKLPKGNYELLVKAYDKKNGNTSSANYVIQNGEKLTTISQAIANNTTLSSGQSYSIRTQEDFAALSEKVNATSDSFNFEGVTLYMENDVTLSGEVAPIGIFTSYDSSNRPFKGTFDGLGNVITYDTVTFTGTGNTISDSRLSLFLYIADGAVIKNVTTKCDTETANISACSGLVGKAEGSDSNLVVVENCINEANVTWNASGSGNVGGIVNYIEDGIIRNCVNKGTVDSRIPSSMIFSGGICGESNSSLLYNLKNEGNVTDFDSSAGNNAASAGIVGSIHGGNGRNAVYNCENKGKIMGKYYAGGIIGSTGSSTTEAVNVYNCCNTGAVYTKTNSSGNVAGIIVRAEQTDLEIMNNVNAGSLGYNYNRTSGTSSSGKYAILSRVNISNVINPVTGTDEIFYNNYFTLGDVINNVTDVQMKKISSSDYLATIAALNSWSDDQNDKSDSSRFYTHWIIDSNKPHLDLGF